MNSVEQYNNPNQGFNTNNIFNGNNLIIVILSTLLILSFLGINLLNITGNFIQSIVYVFGPLVTQILSVLGYTTGTILDRSSDVITDTAKSGLDIANGTVQSVADLLKDASRLNMDTKSKLKLDSNINQSNYKYNDPKPDNTSNPIQNPSSNNKQSWCLVGEYEGKRGCIEVSDERQCLSGQTFQTQQLCINPTQTTYTNP
jgi:hypothetical protein